MAKPGSDEARRLAALSRQAVDLSATAGVPEQIAAQMLAQAEGQLGRRCRGCGYRIHDGFLFVGIDLVVQEGQTFANTTKLAACNRDECDFADKVRQGAVYVEPLTIVWLDGQPDEPPPGLVSHPPEQDAAGSNGSGGDEAPRSG